MLRVPLKDVQTTVDSSLGAHGGSFRYVLRFLARFFLFGSLLFTGLGSATEKTGQAVKNPYEGQPKAVKAGRKLFVQNCAWCHGHDAEGSARVPALAGETTQSVPEIVIVSYITRGDEDSGMPSWVSLTESQRWQIVTYLKSLSSPPNRHRWRSR